MTDFVFRLFLIGMLLMLAKVHSPYDESQLIKKYITIENKAFAKLLVARHRATVRMAVKKKNYNKMSITGALSYAAALLFAVFSVVVEFIFPYQPVAPYRRQLLMWIALSVATFFIDFDIINDSRWNSVGKAGKIITCILGVFMTLVCMYFVYKAVNLTGFLYMVFDV